MHLRMMYQEPPNNCRRDGVIPTVGISGQEIHLMRIRRCIAAVVMTGALAAGSLGAGSATAHALSGPAVTVPAGMTKAQVCDRATGFLPWWAAAPGAARARHR